MQAQLNWVPGFGPYEAKVKVATGRRGGLGASLDLMPNTLGLLADFVACGGGAQDLASAGGPAPHPRSGHPPLLAACALPTRTLYKPTGAPQGSLRARSHLK